MLRARLLLHLDWGFGCALLLWMEKQPLLVLLRLLRFWRLRLLVASVPVCPAGSRDGACLLLDGRRRCSSACGARCRVLATWDLSWSPVRSTLRQVRSSRSSSESFEVVQAGFLPPTAGRSLIRGTSVCSSPLLQVTALLSGLQAGDCGLPLLWIGHARVWVVACPPLLRERRAVTTLVPLMPCASAGISFWSFMASSRLSSAWWTRRACAVPLCACRRPFRLFTGRFLLATVVSS